MVVYFGRIVLEKGLAVFADAIEQARRVRPDLGVLVVGDGPAREWFAAQLPGAVFTGHLVGDALARAVASGEVLLNTSATESFCNVTLESMACGLAVVCSDAPNHRCIVRSDEIGRLCAAADARAYARTILELVDAPRTRQALGRAARTESGRYDWDRILSAVAAVYREAAAVTGAGVAPVLAYG